MSNEKPKSLDAMWELVRRRLDETRSLRDQEPDWSDIIRKHLDLVETAAGTPLGLSLPEDVRARTEKAIRDIAANLSDPEFREKFDDNMQTLQGMLDQLSDLHDDDKDAADDTVPTFH